MAGSTTLHATLSRGRVSARHLQCFTPPQVLRWPSGASVLPPCAAAPERTPGAVYVLRLCACDFMLPQKGQVLVRLGTEYGVHPPHFTLTSRFTPVWFRPNPPY